MSQPTPPKKDRAIRFRGSAIDAKRLHALAKHHRTTASEVLRGLIATSFRNIQRKKKEA